jgi:hypothetical protein
VLNLLQAGIRVVQLSPENIYDHKSDFQPKDTARKPSGDPIPDYSPAAITEDLWHQSRIGISTRRRPGKKGATYENNDFVKPFAGLLYDSRNGGVYNVVNLAPAKGRGSWHRSLRNCEMDGRDKSAVIVDLSTCCAQASTIWS